MGAIATDILYASLTERLIGVFYDVDNELGFGFLESVYQRSLGIAFEERGIRFESQAPITVRYHERTVGRFLADFLVEGVVILELKACRVLEPAHETQVLNDLRATDVEVGLLFHFGERPTFKRIVFSNAHKQSRG